MKKLQSDKVVPGLSKKKGITVGNPLPLNQQPYRPRKETKK